MVRDYTKWDDAPMSLAHFAESAVRAYKIAMTPPMAPVVLVADARAAGRADPDSGRGACASRSCRSTTPPAGDSGAVAEAARMLVAAENPVIVAGPRGAHAERASTLLVELAEAAAGAGRSISSSAAHELSRSRHPLQP